MKQTPNTDLHEGEKTQAVNAYAPTKQRELAFEYGYRAGRARLILEKSNV